MVKYRYMGKYVGKKTRSKAKITKSQTKTYNALQYENLKDKIFMEFYNTYPNGTLKDMQAVVTKYRPDSTPTNNYMYGWRILNDPDVKRRIQKRNAKRLAETKLSYEEKLTYLTGVIMGDIEPDAETKDRLRALDIANRMEGVYVNTNVNLNKSLSIEDERAIVERRIRSVLGEPVDVEAKVVESETVEKEESQE